jgi:hypothetical protein
VLDPRDPAGLARLSAGIGRTRLASVSAPNSSSTRAAAPAATSSSAGSGLGSDRIRRSRRPARISASTSAIGARPSMNPPGEIQAPSGTDAAASSTLHHTVAAPRACSPWKPWRS